jgi:hypothetical protein
MVVYQPWYLGDLQTRTHRERLPLSVPATGSVGTTGHTTLARGPSVSLSGAPEMGAARMVRRFTIPGGPVTRLEGRGAHAPTGSTAAPSTPPDASTRT